MKKIIFGSMLLFLSLIFVSCDVTDEYVVEKWYVNEFTDSGVIVDNGSFFGVEYFEIDGIDENDGYEIGDEIFVRVYESGRLEIVKISQTTS